MPHAEINTLAAKIYLTASQTPTPKNSKTKKNPNTTPEPSETPTDSDAATSDPFSTILEFILGNLWLPAIIVGLVGINIGWRKLTERQNLNGQPLAPLGDIIRRTLRLMFKEDKTPVFMRPQKFAMKMRWLTWQRYWLIAGLAVIFDITAFSGIIPDEWEIFFTALIGLFILGGIQHIRLIFQRRHRILMQMFEVASAECKYPKGSELNPWGWVQITKWNGLYAPAITYVVFPPRVRSEDERFRQAFEANFNGTVSSEHTWMYSWESANNRVLCEPVPFITEQAPYPFPDEHPWNEFPLGIAGGGKEAVVDVTTFPHILVAGTTGAGKASDYRTPIPVPVSAKYPSGWTNFGDIEIGDNVFDENGEKCRVVGISEVRDDFEMYRVSFSDGTFIDASGDHLWFTETRRTRESRWNAIRKKTERRSLISEDGLVALRNLLDGQTASSELTIRQIADAAGVHETTTWLIDIANHLGPVGETQVVADFHYAEQTVKQTQKVTVYSAREAWHALASYQEQRRAPDWYANRAKYRALAESSTDTDVVSSKDLGKALGMSPQKAGALVRHKGIESWVTKHGGGRRAVLQFPARKSWLALATSQARGEGSVWAKNKSLFLTRLAESEPSAEITVVEIASTIGVSNTEVCGMLNRLGVPGRVEKREVELSVPARIVRRKSVIARTYLGQRFIKEVLSRAEVPAHSQEHKRDFGAVRTTLEIRDSLLTSSGSVNHSIPVAGALQLPEATLPIDPYTLGVWLGDGNSRDGNFSGIDCEIADYIAASGYCVTEKIPKSPPGGKNHDDFRLWKVAGLIEKLREENLLQRTTAEGSQKRIPPVYLRASITQRRMLLAGLLDTDGTVAPRGTVHFDNKNKLLAEQVLELARSLGYRATIISKRATLNGEDYGEVYRVAFACEESPFRLSRKTAAFIERTANHNPEKTTRRYVTDVQRIPSVPARCIMVDSPSRLFLAGEAMIPTHNSVTQRTLLLHALQSPDWRVSLIDPKRVELSAYTKHRNVVKVATELDESVALLEGVEQEMQSRYKRMEKEGVNHFKRLKSPPPAMMLMVDELFALLSPENIRSDEGKERDDMHARATLIIGSIARLGRAAGVHMILATQRPDAKVLPGETKALAIDTPILTIEGWKTIEQVRQGDYVFAPDGAPTQVTGVTEVMHDHECYELVFSDGSRLTADAGHLWVTEDAAYRARKSRAKSRAKARVGRTPSSRELSWMCKLDEVRAPVTTKEIANSLKYHGKTNHSVPVADALVFPDADLPVNPYLLGVWLGDGSAGTTNVTGLDEEIFGHVRSAGYFVWRNREYRNQLWRISATDAKAHRWAPGLKGSLRDAGVLEDKHIPEEYMRSSIDQRMELLAGLLDTDGTVGSRKVRSKLTGKAPAGQILLRLTNERLAKDAHELILGLGFQATIREGIASYVKDSKRTVTGPVWIIAFTPHCAVFRLRRKLSLQALESAEPRGTTQRRYIVEVVPVKSVPVKCIAVAHPSRLFLAGRTLIPTHNSNLDCRIAQGRMDTTPSLMVLDSEAATRIPKIKGRAMVRMGGDITEFQAYFLPEDSLTMVLEMSEALASEQMSIQDFKDLIEQARAGDEAKAGGRFRLPRIPVPRGVASRFSGWLERRKRAVEENEAEGKRFASKKSKSSPPITDDPSPSSPPQPRKRGLLGRRGAPEGAVARVEAPEGAVAPTGSQEAVEADFGAPGDQGDRRAAREVRYEGGGDVFVGGDGAAEEDFLPPFRVDSTEIDDPSWTSRGIEGFAAVVGDDNDDDDDDDDIELIFEDEEDFLPPLDLDEEDFLDDIVSGSQPPAPAKPLLPEIPRVEEVEAPSLQPRPDRVATERADEGADEDFKGLIEQGTLGALGVADGDLVTEDFPSEEDDVFGAVAEAPWMPDVIPGSTSGPSPFGGGDVAAPPLPASFPPEAVPPPTAMGAQEIDEEDEPFI